jgi:hypothetical protein
MASFLLACLMAGGILSTFFYVVYDEDDNALRKYLMAVGWLFCWWGMLIVRGLLAANQYRRTRFVRDFQALWSIPEPPSLGVLRSPSDLKLWD